MAPTAHAKGDTIRVGKTTAMTPNIMHGSVAGISLKLHFPEEHSPV